MTPTPQLDHVAIGLRRLADAPAFAQGVLGGRVSGRGPGAGFRWAQWTFAGGGVLEFLEPDGPPDGFLHRFLARRGPGFHHVTFKVPDLRAMRAHAQALGFEVVGYDDRFPAWKECFLHPKQAQGLVVQMAEVNPELDDWSGSAPFALPDGPPAAEPAARVLRLRLAARERAAALRQWRDLLAGQVEERGGELRVRWPDSPIALAVELDPRAEEGPRWLELACARPLALPEGPHPLLGAAFAQVGAQEDEA